MFKHLVIVVAALLSIITWAQDNTLDEDLFGGNQTQENSDDLFGDSFVTEVEQDPNANAADALLTTEGVSLGGTFNLSADLNLNLSETEDESALSSGVADLSTDLYLDARPSADFRVFTKGNLAYSTDSGLSFDLRELFADVDIDNTVFVRAGKQTVNWGVGYFFSPANLINLERIDPENPDAALTGPIAIKAQLPLGSDNLTGYLLMNDFGEDNNFSFAARYEFLLEGFEITTGGIVEDSGHWAVMLTGNGSIEDVTVFAEAVLEGNSEKVFIVKDSSSPSGYSTSTSESIYFSATVGARYSYTTEDDLYTIAGSAQYFFNGLGYEDSSLFTDNPALVGGLIGSGAISINDLQQRGKHYLAANLSSPDLAKSGFNPSLLWLGNLSDGSGFVNANLSYSGLDTITPSLSYRYTYGTEGAEYSPNGDKHNLSLSLNIDVDF